MISEGDICKVIRIGSSATISSLPSSEVLPAELNSLVRVVKLEVRDGTHPAHCWAWCRDTSNREGAVPIGNLNVVLLASEVDKRNSVGSITSADRQTSYSTRSSAVGRLSVRSVRLEQTPNQTQDGRNPRTNPTPSSVVTDDLDTIYGDGEQEYGEANDTAEIRPRKSAASISTRGSSQQMPSRHSKSESGQRRQSRNSVEPESQRHSTSSSSSARSKSRVSSDSSNSTSTLSPRESHCQTINEDPRQGTDLGESPSMDEEPEIVIRPNKDTLKKDGSTQTTWIPFDDMTTRSRGSLATVLPARFSGCHSDSWIVGEAVSRPLLSDLEIELGRDSSESFSGTNRRFNGHSRGEDDTSSLALDHEYAEIGDPLSNNEDDPDYAIVASHSVFIDDPDSSDVELRRHSSRPPSERSWFSRASVQSNDVPTMFALEPPTRTHGLSNELFFKQLGGAPSPTPSNTSKRLPDRTTVLSQGSQTPYSSAVNELDQILALMGSSQPSTSSSSEPSPQHTPEVTRKIPGPRIPRVQVLAPEPTSNTSAGSSTEPDPRNPTKAVRRVTRNRVPRAAAPAPDLTSYPWYVGNASREETQKILLDPTLENETFLVRKSDRVEGYVISIRTARRDNRVKLRHRKIRFTKGQYSSWSPQGFLSIPDLVEAHCSEKGGHKLKTPFDKVNFLPSSNCHPPQSSSAKKEDPPWSDSDSEPKQKGFDDRQSLRPPKADPRSSPMPSMAFTAHSSSESESDAEENHEGGAQSGSQAGVPWRTPDQWVVLSGEVRRLEQVAHGRCGELWKAKFNNNQTIIAMKLFNTNMVRTKDFVTDTSVLRDINHPALAKMLGVHSDPKKTFLLVAYYPLGSIRDYFSRGRRLTTEQLQLIVMEVAVGMEYLSKLDFTHRDLAARNVLLSNDLSPKITDYGLSRLIKPDVRKQLEANMFWKWLAPEVLGSRMTWSCRSDVWSYGVFCWELYTQCAKPPYPDTSSRADLIRHLEAGHRLPKPDSCSGFLYEMMTKCWAVDIEKRITFSDIQLLQTVLFK